MLNIVLNIIVLIFIWELEFVPHPCNDFVGHHFLSTLEIFADRWCLAVHVDDSGKVWENLLDELISVTLVPVCVIYYERRLVLEAFVHSLVEDFRVFLFFFLIALWLLPLESDFSAYEVS